MGQGSTIEIEDLTFFTVGLDHEATDLLLKLSVVTRQSPLDLLARLVRDILVEDAEAHSERPVVVEGPRLN